MEPATPDTPSVVQDNDADEPVLNTYRFRLLGQAVARPRPRACDVIGTPDLRPPREPTMLPALSARCAHEWWGGIEAPTLLAPQFEAALASSPKRLKTMSCDLMALRDLLVRYAEASERGKELAAHLHEPILAALGVHDGKPSRSRIDFHLQQLRRLHPHLQWYFPTNEGLNLPTLSRAADALVMVESEAVRSLLRRSK